MPQPPTLPNPHKILGLSPREDDPVKVIEVAQLMLRRWRRVPLAPEGVAFPHRVGEARNRIREIIAARQAMLERIRAGLGDS
jgi:hypothetical protein